MSEQELENQIDNMMMDKIEALNKLKEGILTLQIEIDEKYLKKSELVKLYNDKRKETEYFILLNNILKEY